MSSIIVTRGAVTWPPLRLPHTRILELRTEASVADINPLMGLVGTVKLLAAANNLTKARAISRLLEAEYPPAEVDRDTFFRMFPVTIMTSDPELATSWLEQRYKPSYRIAIEIAGPGQPVDVATMQIRRDELRFFLSPALFEFFAGDMILSRFAAMFPLWNTFMTSPRRIDGTVMLNLLDNGSRPGLTFCDSRPGYYLIPDSTYMAHDQYHSERIEFRANAVPWKDRLPVAYWRGSASGLPVDFGVGWRTLPRVRLCEIGAEHPDIIDAGLTGVTQITDPDAPADLEARNLTRPRVPAVTYLRYRYQIDIDGYSNAWDGFYLRLLTGSPVLKVASRRGFEQWYYGRLKPWVNYVPIDTDMTDLPDKVRWLQANDDVARKIGDAGRDLAETLDQRELDRAVPVIVAAIRADAGGPLIDLRFGTNAPDNITLASGWSGSQADGVVATGQEGRLVLPAPPGFGDLVLLAEMSAPTDGTRWIAIFANGVPVMQRLIAQRSTVCCALPRSIIGASDAIDLSIKFGEGTDAAPDGTSTVDAGAGATIGGDGVILHRIGLAAAERKAWTGYPNVISLLEDLNEGLPSDGPHDLGSRSTGRSHFSLPPGHVARQVLTWAGTTLYADPGAGRVRHGLAALVPANLFLVQLGELALLARPFDNGMFVPVRLRPEGPFAPADEWILWAGAGLARVFEISTTGGRFALRAAGLFLCAEPDGEITLSRPEAGEWEHFSFDPDNA